MTTFSLEDLEARMLRKVTLPISGEELAEMGDLGSAELVEGEIIQRMPTGHLHGKIEMLLAMLLGAFVFKHKLGHVLGGETGIYTKRNPDTIRGMDLAFISNERFAQVESDSYLDVAPEIIIEIMSPSDRWMDVQQKIDEYFSIDVQQTWIVAPEAKNIYVYHSVDKFDLLSIEDTLNCPAILPGFELKVDEIFGR